MLIENNVKKGDVMTIKLVSGEEIIGRFVSQDDLVFTAEKCRVMVQGQSGVGIAPYAVSIHPDTTLPFNKVTVVIIAETEPEMAKQYSSATSSIQLV